MTGLLGRLIIERIDMLKSLEHGFKATISFDRSAGIAWTSRVSAVSAQCVCR